MAYPTQTHTLDEIVTRFAWNYVGDPNYKNQSFNRRPLLRLLREKRLTASGGNQISHRVNLGSSSVGTFYSQGQQTNIQDAGNWTQANYEWAFGVEPLIIWLQELFKAGNSPAKIQGITEDHVDDGMERLKDLILGQICLATKADSSTDLNTLMELVAEDGEVGGINPATAGQTAWAAKEDSVALDWSSVGTARSRTIKNNCERVRGGGVDAYLLTQTQYEESLDSADNKVTINQDAKTKLGTRNADLGLDNLVLNGTMALWDPTWSDAAIQSDGTLGSVAMALDFSGVHLVEAEGRALKTRKWKETDVNGYHGMVSFIDYIAQLTCSRRASSGRMDNIS
ncbi:MAG: phage major capsid protein [bacterium]|nr:phage major capsid protein [bacterium]